ncbi:MAG: hypothetical protein WCL32_12390 [Planctomycetota bacterium]
MAKKKLQEGEVNRSQAIRDLLKENPKIKASEAISTLAAKGVTVTSGHFHVVKGKLLGRKSRRKKNKQKAVVLITAPVNGQAAVPAKGKSDALATIRKIKGLAAEVGGLRSLRALVEALSE